MIHSDNNKYVGIHFKSTDYYGNPVKMKELEAYLVAYADDKWIVEGDNYGGFEHTLYLTCADMNAVEKLIQCLWGSYDFRGWNYISFNIGWLEGSTPWMKVKIDNEEKYIRSL
jgi:hypothetical protein